MAVKLGTTDATLRLGDAAYPTKAYLGSTLVAATVPGAPVIVNIEVVGLDTEIEHTKPDDGGSTITGYEYDAIGPTLSPPVSTTDNGSTVTTVLPGALSVVDLGVRAVNAIGAGPYSAYRSADEF